ncbi:MULTISPECIES: hypothetical protein [unclassified Dyella]|uniref:hypothetical protein n=1 Tax=Dyella sp. ASV21 TaxID=2795114 RepID=UPI0018EAFF9A|nr:MULTISPECIES: hypothetical protein [unclassified Dyella]
MSSKRNEVDLHEVLKRRAGTVEPVYIDGQINPAVEAVIDAVAEELGTPVRIIQLVDLDTTSIQNASQDRTQAALANSNVQLTLKG